MRTPAWRREPAIPYKNDGTPADASGAGFTLAANTTYYVELGGADATVISFHVLLAAALILTSMTVEDSNFLEALTHSETSGEWNPEDIEAPVVSLGGNMTNDDLTFAKTAGAFGVAMVHLGNFGSMRMRLKIVVGATGGLARIAPHGKY